MTTKNVDWKAFAALVEGSLEKGYFIRADLSGAFETIRSIVHDSLEVYVDSQFMNQFHIQIKSVGRIIHVDLQHETKTLAHWEVSCRA